MSTDIDGASPSVAPDPDDGEHRGSDTDIGSEWVRAEMRRRMAANRSTRGRHARRGDVTGGTPAHRSGPTLAPENGISERADTARPAAPAAPSRGAVPVGDLPENYVPRHSVQTPGPAAEPAAPVSGPIPVVPPSEAPPSGLGPSDLGQPDAAPQPAAPSHAAPTDAGPRPEGGSGDASPVTGRTAGGPLGGPSLTAAGLPKRRRRGGGPGVPLQADGSAPGAAWSRPAPLVPDEPARRLGAPPERLDGPAVSPPWGPPAARGPGAPPSPEAVSIAAPTAAPVGAPVVAPSEAESGVGAPPVPDDGDTDETPAVTSLPRPAQPAAPVPPPSAPASPAEVPSASAAAAVAPVVPLPPPPAAAAPAPSAAAVAPSLPKRTPRRSRPPGPRPVPLPATSPDTEAVRETAAPETPTPETPTPETTAAAPPPPTAASTETAEAPAEVTGEITDEILPGVTDPPTAPHPVVLARRTAMSGRLVGVPAQRASEAAPAVAPRPLTPRNIPIVGTEPSEPGSTRVRVVLSERKGMARPVRTIKDVQEGTPVGDMLRRDLIRSQLRVTLRFALLTAVVLGALPAVFSMLPVVSRVHMLGLHLPWVLLGVLMYPFLVGVAWRYARVADRVEQNFADHVQD